MKRIMLSIFLIVGFLVAGFAQKDSASASEIFEIHNVHKPPAFPGGEAALLRFLANKIVYPNEALENGIAGTVGAVFVINKDGSISDISIVKDIGGGCGEEVLRVLKLMPLWEPAEVDGQPVRARLVLPVNFITDEPDTTIKKGKEKKTSTPKTELIPAKELVKNHYQELDPAMCSRKYNPQGWNDNFFTQLSDSDFFNGKPDSLDTPPLQMPMFPDGTDGLYFHFFLNTKYPKEALRKKLEGRVVLAVAIDEKGAVKSVEVVKSEHRSFSEEAKRVVEDFPKMYPAIKDGKFSPVTIYLPIKFSLN